MAVTVGGTPYVESSDLVANYPAVSLALAEHIDDLPAAILQIVRATDGTARTTSSTSFVDVTGMSVTITPQKDTSTIILIAQFTGIVSSPASGYIQAYYSITTSGNTAISGAELITNGIRDFSYVATGTTVYHAMPKTLIAYASPASISAQTYKLRHRVVLATNVSTINNDNAIGQMFAIEVSA
jgi:hypothetical protein